MSKKSPCALPGPHGKGPFRHDAGTGLFSAPESNRGVRSRRRSSVCGSSAPCRAAGRFPARLRRASRAPCLCLHLNRARTRFFPGAGPRMAPVFPGREKAPAHPQRTETPEKLELCSLAFWAFPLSAGGLRPEGPLSRPAALDLRAQAFSLRTETLEKLSSAPWLFKRFPVSRRFAAQRAA